MKRYTAIINLCVLIEAEDEDAAEQLANAEAAHTQQLLENLDRTVFDSEVCTIYEIQATE